MTPPRQTYNQLAGQKTQRIEAISDGIFAIAMTLLVLDIRVPVLEGVRSEKEVWEGLISVAPRLLAYLVSFMTLGIFWTGHSTQFSFIEKSDRHLNWINIFFLMFVSLLPFTTAFLSEYITFKVSIGLYWLNIFSLGIIIYLNWDYAYRHGYLAGTEDEIAVANKAIRKRVVVAQLLYAGGALLCFINTYLSIVVIILIQLNYALAIFSRFGKKEKKG